MNVCGCLVIWMNLRTLLALTVAAPRDSGLDNDVMEKIKLGDNLMNKIQRALRAKITDDRRPGAAGPGVAGGAPTAAAGPGAAEVPGTNQLAERGPAVQRLTNPYLDTTKSLDVTSRTFAAVTVDDIQVPAAPRRTTHHGLTGQGENRRAYDGERASETDGERRGGGGAPDPQRLDLAPARGGRVASKRLQGRVCQRSVLLPEGPKYDSRGRVYLAAFQRGAHTFQRTRRPRLLLPRCCNCCRKSVLGCE